MSRGEGSGESAHGTLLKRARDRACSIYAYIYIFMYIHMYTHYIKRDRERKKERKSVEFLAMGSHFNKACNKAATKLQQSCNSSEFWRWLRTAAS